MRPRFLIFISLLALAIFLVLFWLRSTKPSVGPAPIPKRESASFQASQQSATNAPPSTNPATAPTITGNNSVEARELKMKQMAEVLNVPVCFYGMVIDQDSNALSGVHVKLGVRHNIYIIPNSLEAAKYAALPREELQMVLNPTTDVVTDISGRFQWVDLHTTGDILGVESLTKDGYESEPGQYSCGAGDGDYNSPVIFKMWSTNIHEKLIAGNKSFQIAPDGRPYFINLTDDTISESGTGNLKVWIQYTNQVVRGQLYDWSARIEAIEGGLLEEPAGTAMFEAPVDGYVSAFQLNGQIKGGQRGDTGERQFYLKLKNGQEYGQMSIGLYAPYNNQIPGLIRLSYVINPSGSRILR